MKLKAIMGASLSATQFYLYGRKHFTQTGYLKSKSSYTSPVQDSPSIGLNQSGADGVNLSDKVVVITGANSGVGKELSTYAAAKGAKLYMICRSEDRARAAREEIIKDISNPENVQILLADVGELSQVRRVVSELQSKTDKVDVLICNAGVLLSDRQETSEGNEVTFASHLLGGSYLLSTLLIPHLQAAGSEARVIYVSSGGMYCSPFPSWDEATSAKPKFASKYNGNLAYSVAKRGQVLLAEQYTKLHPEINWVTAHPGWSETPAVDLAYGSSKKYLEPFRTPWQGAEGIAWLMGTEAKNIKSGEFYLDRQPHRKHLAGPFMLEGTYTKNSEKEVQDMMENLKKTAGL